MDQQINVKVTLYNDSNQEMRVKLDVNGNNSDMPFLPGIQTTIHEEIHGPGLTYQPAHGIDIPKECTTKDEPVPVCLVIANTIREGTEIVQQLSHDDTPGVFFIASSIWDIMRTFGKYDKIDKIYFDMRLQRVNRHVYSHAHCLMIDNNPKGLVIPIWIK